MIAGMALSMLNRPPVIIAKIKHKAVIGLNAQPGDFLFSHGQWPILAMGGVILVFTCIGWWGDVIKESRGGDHTPVVDIGLRYGMILFIASEVMFFVAWFWMFFELAIDH